MIVFQDIKKYYSSFLEKLLIIKLDCANIILIKTKEF